LSHYAETEEEAFVLTENVWAGWPDPPQWVLIKAKKRFGAKWKECGSFWEFPDHWSWPHGKPE